MTEAAPASFHAWFEAGLHAKARRDWDRCLAWNPRALELFGEPEAAQFDGANPAAWNPGIAATALGDWDTARRAWTAHGISGLADGTEIVRLSQSRMQTWQAEVSGASVTDIEAVGGVFGERGLGADDGPA